MGALKADESRELVGRYPIDGIIGDSIRAWMRHRTTLPPWGRWLGACTPSFG